jgi:hypothetical protein
VYDVPSVPLDMLSPLQRHLSEATFGGCAHHVVPPPANPRTPVPRYHLPRSLSGLVGPGVHASPIGQGKGRDWRLAGWATHLHVRAAFLLKAAHTAHHTPNQLASGSQGAASRSLARPASRAVDGRARQTCPRSAVLHACVGRGER